MKSKMDVADRFDVTISSVYKIITRVSKFLSGMAARCIKWPSPDELNGEIQHSRRTKGIPVFGAIDGSHIKIHKPSANPDDYIFKKMHDVMHKYKAVGLSAPQIGIPLQIIAVEFPESRKKEFSPEVYNSRGMKTIPFKIIVNPKMKIVNFEKEQFSEACESVRGYSAEVPRYREVLVTGYNQEGEPLSWQVSNWGARILQHEIDHLQGRMFTDKMDRSTLICTCWERVNYHAGRITIPFQPK